MKAIIIHLRLSRQAGTALICYYFFVVLGRFNCTKIHHPIEYYKSLPNVGDFYQLVTGYRFYADKSLLIERLWNNGYKVNLVTRPRGWGAATNADMLERFFDPEVDSEGRIVPVENRLNDKLFTGGSIVRPEDGRFVQAPALKIASSPDTMKHLGRHPVISLDLQRIRVTIGNHSEILDGMKTIVRDLFRKRSYVKKGLTDAREREQFERYASGVFDEVKMNVSLKLLAASLRRYFNRTVCLLIRNYDTPIVNMMVRLKRKFSGPSANSTSAGSAEWKIYRKAIESEDFRKTLTTVSSFINNCYDRGGEGVEGGGGEEGRGGGKGREGAEGRGEGEGREGEGEGGGEGGREGGEGEGSGGRDETEPEPVEKVLITGIFRIAATGWRHFTNPANLTNHVSLLDGDDTLGEFYYGFTEEETYALLDKLSSLSNRTDHTLLKQRYGYNFTGRRIVYRPRSIAEYVANNGSVNVEDDGLLPGDENDLERQILLCEDMQFEIQHFADSERLSRRVRRLIEFDFAYAEFVSMLSHYGYFNFEPDVRYSKGLERFLSVPNLHVRQIFRTAVLRWLRDRLSVSGEHLRTTASLLSDFDVNGFRQRLLGYFRSIPNDIVLPKKDKYYAAVFKSITWTLQKNYTVSLLERASEFYSGSYLLFVSRGERKCISLMYRTTLNPARMSNDTKTLLNLTREQNQVAFVRDYPSVERFLYVVVLIWNRDAVLEYAIDEVSKASPLP